MKTDIQDKLIGWVISGLLVLNSGGCVSNNSASFDPVTQDMKVLSADYPPMFHELLIPSHDVLLSGFLLSANGSGPHPTVILLHGYPGNEKNLDLAQSVRRAGFNVLFFHYRGAWGSEGNYAFMHLAEDVESVLHFLRESDDKLRVDSNKISVIGHSMGGFTALRAGARDKEVVCVAGIAASNLGELAKAEDAAKQGFKNYTDALFMLEGFDGDKALQEIATHATDFDVTKEGPGLAGKSVLLIAGAQDTVVPPSVQERIADAYSGIAGLKLASYVIPGDHAFSVSRIQLQRRVIDWLQSDCR